jgi:dTMP kinase
MKHRGFLIVFEGLDGSGKGTQLEIFRKFLETEGVKGRQSQFKMFKSDLEKIYAKNSQVEMFGSFLADENRAFACYDFPRYEDNFWGGMVGRMLNKDFGSRINPYMRSTFYLLDQADAAKEIRRDLRAGKVVICNRYITSSFIFQPAFIKGEANKQKYLRWLELAGFHHLGIVKPDLVLALYVDPLQAQQLIEKKTARGYIKGKKKDLNEENLSLQIRTAKEMLKRCQEFSYWRLVNCMDKDGNIRSKEEIAGEIRNNILPYLK